MASELIRRGQNVTVRPVFNQFDSIMQDVTLPWKNVTPVICTKGSERDDIVQYLAGKEDGTRLAVEVHTGRGGHVFTAEKIEGQIYFYDTQMRIFGCDAYFKAIGGTTPTRFMEISSAELEPKYAKRCYKEVE